MDGSGKNKIMMIVIILLLVLLLGTIAGISWYVIGVLNKEPEDIQVTPPAAVDIRLEELVTFSTGRTTRNLLNTGTGRGWFLQIDVSFEIDGSRDREGALIKLMTDKIDMVKSLLNDIIGNWTYEDLNSVNGEERLREQILEVISDAFQTTLIVRVNTPNIVYTPVP
ncbi:MAG: flagellar basal body-associated FliL family protein [Defluviitaleaceae bacterium]|nr:flagellar basal body-associated FliL family protein [Defluviitaleaceae bacterium]MCL2835858.1 flagellar basal body-associated FliL family protein [Defluviitaleaceae bacterium]